MSQKNAKLFRQLERKADKVQMQSTPPFCVNCSHFMPGEDGNDGSDKSKEPPRCSKARFLDLVSGKEFLAYCTDFRHDGTPCGMEGRFFESKFGTSETPPPAANGTNWQNES